MIWPAAFLVPESVARTAIYAISAVLGVYLFFLTVLLLVAMRRAGSHRARRSASADLRPKLRAALVEFLAGGTDDSLFRTHIKRHAEDISESIQLFQTTVGGSARDRLCALALDLGLVHQWYEDCRSRDAVRRRGAFANLAFASAYEPCRRVYGDALLNALKDGDQEVRISAGRGLVLAADADQIELLFATAIQADLLTRVVLTEDLRRYAATLAAGPVHEALRTGNSVQVRTTLEILLAWERAIPLVELRELLEHRDRRTRVLAFRLASFVPVDSESRGALLRSLQDDDGGIRELAIAAVGRQKITEAVPELGLCLQRENSAGARQAAAALAAMSPEGWRVLEELSASPNPETAQVASQTLARARTGA